MPYIKSVTKAGNTVEVEMYYSSRYKKKGIKRSDKVKPTSEAQKKINRRHAETTIRRQLNENFGFGDYHVVLGYKRCKGEEPVSIAQMNKDIRVFLRKLRKVYHKQDSELKYIRVMEIGKRGARHNHLVINKIDISVIQELWSHGRIYIYPLDKSGQYRKLAAYFIKWSDTVLGTDMAIMGKRWSASKNLVIPEPKKTIVSSRDYYREFAQVPKGYYLDKDTEQIGIHSPEYYGYGFYRYTLLRI